MLQDLARSKCTAIMDLDGEMGGRLAEGNTCLALLLPNTKKMREWDYRWKKRRRSWRSWMLRREDKEVSRGGGRVEVVGEEIDLGRVWKEVSVLL